MWEKIKYKLNGRLILIIPYVLTALIFIIFPTIMLLITAFKPVNDNTFLDVASDPVIWDVLGRSVWMGLVAATLSLVLAFPFTWIIARSESQTFRLLSLVLMVSPLLIFSIAKVFSIKILILKILDEGRIINLRPGVEAIMIFGMVYLYLPFMVIPLYPVLRNMPNSLIEASYDLGFNRVWSVLKVVIPYATKGIFAGLAVVFMLSSTSLIISNTLVPASSGHSVANINYILIGNLLDTQTLNMASNALAAQQGSSIALITIIVLMSIYALIYAIPILVRKILGGKNV